MDENSKCLTKFHIVAGLVWLSLAMVGGTTLAYRLISPEAAEFLMNIEWLNFGRLRMFHTHAAIFGWLTNGFFAFSYYAVPKLVGQPLFAPRLAKFNSYFSQLAILLGALGLLSGFAEGVEYAEAPWWADVIFALSFVLVIVSILGTIIKAGQSQLYISAW